MEGWENEAVGGGSGDTVEEEEEKEDGGWKGSMRREN